MKKLLFVTGNPGKVISPAKAQATSSHPGAPTSRDDSAEVMKMPEPIMEPATIVVASKRPSLLGSVFWNPGCVDPDRVIVPIRPPWL